MADSRRSIVSRKENSAYRSWRLLPDRYDPIFVRANLGITAARAGPAAACSKREHRCARSGSRQGYVIDHSMVWTAFMQDARPLFSNQDKMHKTCRNKIWSGRNV